jgi:hypothetical protein
VGRKADRSVSDYAQALTDLEEQIGRVIQNIPESLWEDTVVIDSPAAQALRRQVLPPPPNELQAPLPEPCTKRRRGSRSGALRGPREGEFISLFQIGFYGYKVFVGVKLGHVRDGLVVARDLEEDRVVDPAPQMYCDPHGVGHDHQVGKDTGAPQQDVSFPGDDFYRTKRSCKGLDGGIKRYHRVWAIAKNLSPIACAAGVPLILAGERPAALGAHPGCLHILRLTT